MRAVFDNIPKRFIIITPLLPHACKVTLRLHAKKGTPCALYIYLAIVQCLHQNTCTQRKRQCTVVKL